MKVFKKVFSLALVIFFVFSNKFLAQIDTTYFNSLSLADPSYIISASLDDKTIETDDNDNKNVIDKITLTDSIHTLNQLIQSLSNDQSSAPALSISGFLDLNYFRSSVDNSELNYGQFEIDFSTQLFEKLSFEGAIALSGESILPGAGYLDYHFSGPEEGHDARGAFFTHSGLHLGQFDVPFGKYYEQIPSPARNISTIPFAVQRSINCFNTFGLNVYTNYSITNLNAFVINGIDGGYILGGRAGLYIGDFVEVGGSVLNNFDSDNYNSSLLGLDFSSNLGLLNVSSELIWGDGIVGCEAIDNSASHFGYYVESTIFTSDIIELPVDLVFRYGAWKSDTDLPDIENNISHFDTTLNYIFHEQLTVKFEYHTYFKDGNSYDNNYGMQVVISF